MFPEADAFLDAIWAAPGDDTPRLVYADWLEEHGYPEYARFIRLSCHLAREVLPPVERADLRRDRFLLSRAIAEANPRAFEVPGWNLNSYDYGIPSRHLSLDPDAFLRTWPHWWPFYHPRSLRLYDVTGHEAEVARCEFLRRVDVLECTGRADGVYFGMAERDQVNWQPVAGSLLRGLSAGPARERLTALRIEPVEPTATDLSDFAGSELATRLTELHLWVRLADGSWENLRAVAGSVRDEIARFLDAHRHRLRTQHHQCPTPS